MKKSIITSLSVAALALSAASPVFATASVTTLATTNMSADTAAGVYTTLTGPVLTEGANRDIGIGAIVLNAPTGFAFNPAAIVSAIVTRVSGTSSPVTLTAATGTVTTASITITVSAQDTFSTTLSSITWSGIQVRPTAGTPLASGTITKASGGAAITGITSGSTSFGTLTETVGAAAKLAFTTQPTNITAGVTMGSFVVQVEDQFTNAVAQSGTAITLTLNGSTIFSGTNPQTTAANGKATFSDFVVNHAANGLNFTTANSAGLANTNSANFNILPAAASAYRINAASATPQAGVADALTITLVDQYQNIVTNFTGTKSLTFAGLSAGADSSLPTVTDNTGTARNFGVATTITLSNGVSAIGGSLVAHKPEGPVSLTATDGSLSTSTTGGTPVTLTVSPGVANRLAFTIQPTNMTAGITMGSFVVQIQDQFSNSVAQSGSAITLTLNGGTLFSGTNPRSTDASGKATFNDFLIRQAASNLNFTTANSTGLVNSTSANFNITPAASSTTVASSSNPSTYGQSVTFTAAVTGVGPTPTGTATFKDGTNVVATVALDGTAHAAFTTNGLIAASHAITAGYSGDITFLGSSSSTLTQTVNAQPLSITANSTNKTYGQTLTLVGTQFTSSGLVNSDIVASVTLTSSGTVASATAAGSPYSIVPSNASGTGLANYTIAYVNGSLTVNKAALSITANSTNKTYGQTVTFAGTEFTSSGLVNSDTVSSVTLTSSGAAASAAPAGSPYTIVPSNASGTGLANYTIAYTNGTLTVNKVAVTGGITAGDKVYDGTTTTTISSYNLSGVLSNDSVSVSASSVSFADKNVSSGAAAPVVAVNSGGSALGNFLSDTNFVGGNAYATNSVIDTSAATNPAPAAVYQTERFGNNFTYTFGGIATTRTYTVRLHFAELYWTNVGQRVFNVSINGTPALTNFDIIAAAGAQDRAVIKQFPARANTNGQIVVQYTAVIDNAKASAIEIIGNATIVTASGLSLSGPNAGNYTLSSTSATTTAAITPAPLTVKANNQSLVYGTTVPVLTASYTGFVNGETTNVLSGAPSLSTVATPTSPVANSPYSIVVTNGTLSAQNYSFGFVNGTLTLTPATLTASVFVSDKTYDGTTTATISSNSLAGVVGSDNVALAVGTAGFLDKTVANNKPVNVIGLSLIGTNAANYSLLSTSASTTASIHARALVVSATGVNKVYDGTTTATVTLSDNRIAGDSFTNTYSAAAFADKTAAVGKTVTVTGIAISGTDAGNYTANTTATTTANISAASITGSITASDKTYDGTTAATISGYGLSGVIGSDAVALTGGSASFADKNVGHGKPVTATGLSLTGTNASNYSLLSTGASTTASINARALVVTATGINKIYDGTTTATVTLSDNRVLGDSFTDAYTSAAFADKTAAVGKTVTVTGIAISGADAGNYTANTTATTTANITSASVTGSITASDKTYDGTTTATISGYSLGGTVGGDNVSLTGGSASFADKNVGNNKTVTATGLSLTGTNASNYSLLSSTATTTASIHALSLLVTATANNKTYDGTTTATITLSDNRVSGDSFTDSYASATFSDNTAGIGKTVTVSGISISGTNAGNYTANTTATTTANITSGSVTGSITASNKTYDGTTTATISSYSLSGVLSNDSVSLFAAAATFADKNVSSAAGTPVVAVNSGGSALGNFVADTNFLGGSTYATNSVIDTSAVTNPAPAAVYQTERFGNNFTYTFGGIATTRTYTVRLHFAELYWTNVGQRVFNVSINGSPALTNFDIIAAAGAQNRAIIKQFPATANTNGQIVVQYTSVIDNAKASAIEIIGNASIVTASGLSLSGPNAGNYTLISTSATTTAAITPAPLTVKANNQSLVYGTTVPVLTASYTGFVNGETTNVLSGAPSLSTAATATSPVANSPYSIVVTNGTLSAQNYSFGFVNGMLTLTPATLTASVFASDKTYDGTTTATVSSNSLSGVVGSDNVALAAGPASFTDKNVANNKPVNVIGLSLIGTNASDYSLLSTSASTTASIHARTLVVSATGINKVYDGTTAASVTLSDNRVAGDSFTNTYSAAAFADKTAAVGKTVTVTGIAISGTDAGNYAANSNATTTATITPASVTGSITVSDKTYDGTNTATISGYGLSGVIGADNVTLAGGTASFADKNVGHGKPVTATGLSLIGTNASNYSLLSTSASTIASINARALVVSATGVNKTYDGTTTATVTLADNRVAGDSFTDTYTSAAFSDKTAAIGKTVSVSGIGISGTDAGNYSANTTATTTANITSASVTGSITASDKTYDGTTTATISGYSLGGTVGGDNVSLTGGSASFADKNVGNNKTVTGTGLSLTGTNASNYSLLSSTATTTASIHALSLLVTATANNKTYDGTTTVTVTLSDNRVSGDSFTDSYASATFSDNGAGIGKTITVSGISISGTDAGNYTANTTATTTANITSGAVTGNIAVSDKTYDGTTTTTISSYNLSGVLSNDAVSVSASAVSFADKNVSSGAAAPVVAVNSGGSALGNFLADTNFVGGNAYATNSVIDTSAATNPAPAAVYQTERFGNNFTYTFGGIATTRTYTVRLHFAELYWTNVGQRVFNVSINGTPALTNFDIIAAAGARDRAIIKQFPATANTNGQIVVQYTSVIDNAKASAIEIIGNASIVTASGLSLSGPNAGNYTLISTSATTTAAITPAPLTVKANNQSLVYGTTVPVLTASYTGFVNGETTNVLSGAPSLSTAATATSPVANSPYSIVVTNGTLAAQNYSFGFVNGTLTLTPATLTASVFASDKTYDGTTTATVSSNSLSGVVGSDNVALAVGPASFLDKNVANNKPVNVIGLSLIGTNAANYSLLSTSASTTASIHARTLVVSATGINKAYDGTTAASVTLSDNRVAGDSFTNTYSAAAFADKTAAVGKTVTVTGIAISGTDAGNYTANTTASTTANIVQATVTGSITASDKTYDGTTAATISGYGLSGVIGSDAVALTGGTASFADKNVGQGKPVTASGLSLIGTNAGNYALASTSASTTASITQASLAVMADNKSKTAGLPNPQLTASYNGFLNGDGPSVLTTPVSLSTTATNSSPVGTYPIAVSNGVAPNYTINYFYGTLTVGAMPQLSVNLNGNQVILTCAGPTLTNQTYQFEFKDNLGDATWTPLSTPIGGTGASITFTNQISGQKGFFQVEIAPE